MNMYRVFVVRSAQKQVEKFPKKDQKRIVQAIISLSSDPWKGKKLEGEQKGKWSIRVWPYRIIYTIEKDIVTVTVLRIGHRKDVYK